LEHHFDYGFDVVKEGKIKRSGYSTPCDAIELFRSRPAPSPQETPLPCIPTPCSYLYIEGMNVHCQDSYSPSRVNCHHCVNWRCWDITNVRENAIRNATLDAIIEFTKGNSETIEADDGTLEDAVFLGELLAKIESLRTKQEPHP
jgi:hypothetical protein